MVEMPVGVTDVAVDDDGGGIVVVAVVVAEGEVAVAWAWLQSATDCSLHPLGAAAGDVDVPSLVDMVPRNCC